MTETTQQTPEINFNINGEDVPLQTLILYYKKYNDVRNNLNANALNYYKTHRDKVLMKKRERLERNKYKCECGAVVKSKIAHLKTVKHLKYIQDE